MKKYYTMYKYYTIYNRDKKMYTTVTQNLITESLNSMCWKGPLGII